MKLDVIIVGGGLTGLAIAERLEAADADYLLLEARNRWGGRIRTLGPHALDAGPAWFWPGQDRVAELAARFGLTVFRQHSEGFTVFEDRDGTVRRDLGFALNPEALRLKGGLTGLTDGLSRRLSADRIHLNHAVTSLARARARWRVLAETGSGEQAFTARTVIVAIPPRLAAARIRFDPALPDAAVQALHRIPTWMAGHAKALVRFETPFWRTFGLSGDAISHRGPMVQIHDAGPSDGRTGALFGFVGLTAEQRASAGKPALEGAITRQVSALFGSSAPKPLSIDVIDWAEEAFTATDADHAIPNGHPAYRMPPAVKMLAEDGLVFASTELAPDNGGLIEGALASAELTSRTVLER